MQTMGRRWNGARGEGKLFSFDLLDADGEIRITAFNDQADKFFERVQVGWRFGCMPVLVVL